MKVEIGDVIEIPTSDGLAYALYSHRHDNPPTYGALLRVIDGQFKHRPHDLESVVKMPVRFSAFFPLQAAVDRGLVKVIGRTKVPIELEPFPIFRCGVVNPTSSRVESWWLWDGQNEWPVEMLTREQRLLPIRAVWNDKLLIERIESGWRPEHD